MVTRMRTAPDVEPLIRYLAGRGGQIKGVHAGNVTRKLANFLGVPPYRVGVVVRRMEERGLIQVDRGKGGRFIYGVKLLVDPETGLKHHERIYGDQNLIPAGVTAHWPQEAFYAAATDNIKLQPAPPDLEDYSGLAAKLLEKAVDAIVENERLRERIAYLEGKVAERPLTLDERRRNVVKDLLEQVGPQGE